jgi:type III restriction enzyme
MSNFEVPSPILNSPFEEPKEHWWILEAQAAERRQGRRPSLYFYREPGRQAERGGIAIEMKLVNQVRERVEAWRKAGYPGVTRTTLDLLQWWRREGRQHRLFFAQIEAVETIIFLVVKP